MKELIKRIEHDEIHRSIREDINEYIDRKEVSERESAYLLERKRALSISSNAAPK